MNRAIFTILTIIITPQPILADDIVLQMDIEDGSLELEWSNHSKKGVNLITSYDTERGTHYDPYQLYFVSDTDEVTVLRFSTWAVSSSPSFSEIAPDERFFLKIDLEEWIKEKTEFGFKMPEDGKYLAFVRYRETGFHNKLPDLNLLANACSNIVNVEIVNCIVKRENANKSVDTTRVSARRNPNTPDTLNLNPTFEL